MDLKKPIDFDTSTMVIKSKKKANTMEAGFNKAEDYGGCYWMTGLQCEVFFYLKIPFDKSLFFSSNEFSRDTVSVDMFQDILPRDLFQHRPTNSCIRSGVGDLRQTVDGL